LQPKVAPANGGTRLIADNWAGSIGLLDVAVMLAGTDDLFGRRCPTPCPSGEDV
jgi:hypothetical protein